VLNFILLSFFFTMLIAYSLHDISNLDIWLHLKAGEYITEYREILTTNTFSYPVEDHPWHDIYWLFQISIFNIYGMLGINGLILFKVTILIFVFIFLLKTRDRDRGYTIPITCLILTVLAANERFIVRPEMVSLFFVALYFYALHTYKYYNNRVIYLLPFFHVIWINMHGLYVMGLGLVLAYLAGELIMWKIHLPFICDHHILKGKKYLNLVYLFLILLAVGIINPCTLKMFLLPLELFKDLRGVTPQLGTPGIPELVPPFSEDLLFPTQVVFYYKMLLVLSALSFLLNIRRLNITHLLIYSGFLYVSLLARRNISYFALIAAPITSLNISAFLSDIYPLTKSNRLWGYKKPIVAGFQILLILVMTVSIYHVVTNRYYIRDRNNKRFSLGISQITYPIKAVDFIIENRIPGNIFNDTLVGDYFIWRCYPERKAFLDGRMDFGEKFLFHHDQPMFWERIVDTYHINYALLGHGWSPNLKPLIRMLYTRNDWILVYFDDIAAVFVKDDLRNQDIIRRFHTDFRGQRGLHPPETKYHLPVSHLHMGDFYRTIGINDRAEIEYRRCIEIYPKYLEAHLNLGDIYEEKGLLDKAMSEYRKALSIKPDFAEGYSRLANIYTQKGLFNEAIAYYKRALKIKPRLLATHNNLGLIYIHLKRYREAMGEFEAILKVDPENEMARKLVNICRKNL